MMLPTRPPTPIGVGSPTPPLVSRGSEEEWRMRMPTGGPSNLQGGGSPTLPPFRGKGEGPPQIQGKAMRLHSLMGGTRSLPAFNRVERSLHWIGEIEKSPPPVGAGEQSLPTPRKNGGGTGERRGGAYKTDQNNQYDSPTRAGNSVC